MDIRVFEDNVVRIPVTPRARKVKAATAATAATASASSLDLVPISPQASADLKLVARTKALYDDEWINVVDPYRSVKPAAEVHSAYRPDAGAAASAAALEKLYRKHRMTSYVPTTGCAFTSLGVFSKFKLAASKKPLRACFVARNLTLSAAEMFMYARDLERLGQSGLDEYTIIHQSTESGATARFEKERGVRPVLHEDGLTSTELPGKVPAGLDFLLFDWQAPQPGSNSNDGAERANLPYLAAATELASTRLRAGGTMVMGFRLASREATSVAIAEMAAHFKECHVANMRPDGEFQCLVCVGLLPPAKRGRADPAGTAAALRSMNDRRATKLLAVAQEAARAHRRVALGEPVESVAQGYSAMSDIISRGWFLEHSVPMLEFSDITRVLVDNVLRALRDQSRSIAAVVSECNGDQKNADLLEPLERNYVSLQRSGAVHATAHYKRVSAALKAHEGIRSGLERMAGGRVSQAFFKLWEILDKFRPPLPCDGTTSTRTLHVCEAPGNFVACTHHYVQTRTPTRKWRWSASTLKPSDIGDDFGIVRRHPENWDWGADGTGNLLTNADAWADKYAGAMDLCTSDCGLGYSGGSDHVNHEHIMSQLLRTAAVLFVRALKPGGSAVLKAWVPLSSPDTLLAVATLEASFRELHIYKPEQNPGNAEVYLVALGFRKSVVKQRASGAMARRLRACSAPFVQAACTHLSLREAVARDMPALELIEAESRVIKAEAPRAWAKQHGFGPLPPGARML
jgi:hypothetical protein